MTICRVHECAYWMNAKPEQEQDEKKGMMGFCKNPIHILLLEMEVVVICG